MNPIKSAHQYTRRIFYINKNFQRDFILKFCTLAGLGSVLTMALVYWMAKNSTTVTIWNGHVAVRTTADYLLPMMFQTVLLEVIIGTIATIMLTMIISFRIAGPLYRFKMMFYGLSKGDLSVQMHLRSDDQLKELAGVYNESIARLGSKIKALGQVSSLDELKRELEQFKTS